MTRYYYDTEFVEDGHTIDLISIGIIDRLGREYYAHLDSYDLAKAQAHPFVSKNVLPHLEGIPRKPKPQVAQEVAAFITGRNIELWGYFPSYDHVALAQLYGTMMDLPRHIPMRTNCIAQLGSHLGKGRPPIQQAASEHDALSDARWTRDTHLWLLGQAWGEAWSPSENNHTRRTAVPLSDVIQTATETAKNWR